MRVWRSPRNTPRSVDSLARRPSNQPKLDVAALLAREAVALDTSPRTEGTLLSTLMRSPAVIATFSMPTHFDPKRLRTAPDRPRGWLWPTASPTRSGCFARRTMSRDGRLLTDFFRRSGRRRTPPTGRCSCLRRRHPRRARRAHAGPAQAVSDRAAVQQAAGGRRARRQRHDRAEQEGHFLRLLISIQAGEPTATAFLGPVVDSVRGTTLPKQLAARIRPAAGRCR